jgi:uncharacterized membrane protein
MDKIKQWMYYFIIGIVSMIALCFLPMIGSNVGLGWNLPNTVVGWIVWITVKIIVAVLNVLIFHCFMLQAIINIKEHEKYQEAREILRLTEQKDFIPRSPAAWNKQQYGQKGVTIFITTALSTIALTQAMLTFDWMAMLTYLFTIIMGLIFGIMQMKTAEDYWTDEFWQYAQQVKRDMELAEKERAKQANDSSSDSSRSDILDTGVGSSDISDNSIGMVVDGDDSCDSVLGGPVYASGCTAISTDNVCEENI